MKLQYAVAGVLDGIKRIVIAILVGLAGWIGARARMIIIAEGVALGVNPKAFMRRGARRRAGASHAIAAASGKSGLASAVIIGRIGGFATEDLRHLRQTATLSSGRARRDGIGRSILEDEIAAGNASSSGIIDGHGEAPVINWIGGATSRGPWRAVTG